MTGHLTSGAYGHHLGVSIGLGYIPADPGESADLLLASRYAIEIAGERFPAIASLEPFYDPKSTRMRS
jgi:4-methylaminobutanoate oxidase (formaldehyde-forming)